MHFSVSGSFFPFYLWLFLQFSPALHFQKIYENVESIASFHSFIIFFKKLVSLQICVSTSFSLSSILAPIWQAFRLFIGTHVYYPSLYVFHLFFFFYCFSLVVICLLLQLLNNKESTCNAGHSGHMGWIPGLGWKDPQRRKWQCALAFLPRKSHGQRSLAGYSQWGHKESDMT